MTTPHRRSHRRRPVARPLAARLAGLAGLVLAAATSPVAAGEAVIFDGRQGPPDAARLAGILWPAPAVATPAARPPGGLTRSIRLGGGTAAPAPAPAAQEAAPGAFGMMVRFAFDSAEVLPESRPYLDSVGEMLRLPQAQGRRVAIVGHADASGGEAYNQVLSERRAAAVRAYLEARFGIDGSRLEAAGAGAASPVEGADPYAAVNRRVEFRADAAG